MLGNESSTTFLLLRAKVAKHFCSQKQKLLALPHCNSKQF